MLGWVPRKIKQNLRPWMINKKDFGSEIASVSVMSADAWEKANLITENELADGGTNRDLKGASEHLQKLRRLMVGLCYVNFPPCVMVSLFLDMGVSKRTPPSYVFFLQVYRKTWVFATPPQEMVPQHLGKRWQGRRRSGAGMEKTCQKWLWKVGPAEESLLGGVGERVARPPGFITARRRAFQHLSDHVEAWGQQPS